MFITDCKRLPSVSSGLSFFLMISTFYFYLFLFLFAWQFVKVNFTHQPSPTTRHPPPATHHPPPATRHPPPVEKSCHTLCGLLIQMQNISWQSSDMCRKQNFVTLDFYLQLSPLPSFFGLRASFFSLAGHLVSFILVGNVLSEKRFRIIGLDESKGR